MNPKKCKGHINDPPTEFEEAVLTSIRRTDECNIWHTFKTDKEGNTTTHYFIYTEGIPGIDTVVDHEGLYTRPAEHHYITTKHKEQMCETIVKKFSL